MNTNATTHTDFIFSITADWAFLLPISVIVAVAISLVIYKTLKRKNPN